MATNELPLPEEQNDTDSSHSTISTSVFSHSTIAEDAEEESIPSPDIPSTDVPSPDEQNNRLKSNEKKYTWRINLSKSEQYWSGWFENLSSKFLDLPVPKLLLLASIDGLDRSLTVGQMQGKFQLQVLARCGHAVHEVNIPFWTNLQEWFCSYFCDIEIDSFLNRIALMKLPKLLPAIWFVTNSLKRLEIFHGIHCAANCPHISFFSMVLFSYTKAYLVSFFCFFSFSVEYHVMHSA